MIAVAENNGRTVLIFGTVGAYLNGRDPIAFETGASVTDQAIASLGFERVGDWRVLDGAPARFVAVRRRKPCPHNDIDVTPTGATCRGCGRVTTATGV